MTGQLLRELCNELNADFRPPDGGQRCFVVDGWDLAYERAGDSEDGRHYRYDSPTANTLLSLFVSGLGALAAQNPEVRCCGVQQCDD